MRDLPKTLIFLGPQGSGKGTQAKLLVEKFGYTTYGTGDILRAISQEDSELGRKVKETIDAGHLVDPDLISEVVKEKLSKLDPDKLVIIDGYPRSMKQLRLMKEIMPEMGREGYLVLYFDISEGETLKRLGLRAEKEGRADDAEGAIRKRLEHFRSETLPMVEQMERDGKVIRINGMPSVEEIHSEVLKKLSLSISSEASRTR